MNPQLVEKCVAALLQSAPQQLPLKRFLEEYSNLMLQDLPYHELGHANPTAFLLTLPQTVRVTIDEAGGVFLDCIPVWKFAFKYPFSTDSCSNLTLVLCFLFGS